MTSPTVVAITAGAWQKVATNKTEITVYPLSPRAYLVWTYRDTAAAAPTTFTEAIRLDKPVKFVASDAFDFYIAAINEDGNVRIDYGTTISNASKTKTRVAATPYSSAAAPVVYEVDPGAAFKLNHILITLSSVPTSAGSITVYAAMADATEIIIDTLDPVAMAQTQYPLRYDVVFADGVKFGVDYTNPDARTVKIYSTYELDEAVE